MKRLSVIIPCRNEEAKIGGLLQAIAKQSILPDEVLVVDSGSTDGTVAIVQQFGDPRVRLVSAPIGVSAARNAGADSSTGEWLVFLDADVTIDPDFFAQIQDALNQPPGELMGFHFYAVSSHVYDRLMWSAYQQYCRFTSHTRWPNFPGFGMVISRRLHQAIGGFNTKLHYSEDSDYAMQAVRRGAKVRFLDQPHLGVSMRRLDRYGRLKMLGQYLNAEIRRLAHGGNAKHSSLEYEFGTYDHPSQDQRRTK